MADLTDNSFMAAGETDDPNAIINSYEAAAAITKGSPVYFSADHKVSPSPGADDAIGISMKTVALGEQCPVLTKGRVKVVANGAIVRGKAVCSAAGGNVAPLADQAVAEGGSASYTIYYNRKLGTALETTAADNDLLFIFVSKS